MIAIWPRGSEWRKWDLHLHAPGTKQSDQFKTADGANVWDTYCRKLHDSDVQVFGIADYFSADGYFSAREEFKARYPDSTKVFFPNIELRTNDVVNKQQEEVNIHVLFNTFCPNHADKIKSFLNTLKTSKTDGSSREVRASDLKHESDYAAATTTRAFIQKALEDTYGKGADVLDCVLTITAANNDGIRPERGRMRKLLITDELDKFSDAFFGNAGNVEYFLKTNRAEDKNEYTKPKPVLSGCDAHSLSDLDEKLGQVVFPRQPQPGPETGTHPPGAGKGSSGGCRNGQLRSAGISLSAMPAGETVCDRAAAATPATALSPTLTPHGITARQGFTDSPAAGWRHLRPGIGFRRKIPLD